ncbi:MAG: OsmC family protein [Turneriella sp.]|nr:OsmC family protein [Turneriella sp.]
MPLTRVILKRIGEPYHFEARNETGNSVLIDAGSALGGTGRGARPMELLLMGLAGCSAIDVVLILNKQKQEITAIEIEAHGERGDAPGANPFTAIHLIFRLRGSIDAAHLERAIKLSLEKYCSAAKMLEKTAKITWEYELHGG